MAAHGCRLVYLSLGPEPSTTETNGKTFADEGEWLQCRLWYNPTHRQVQRRGRNGCRSSRFWLQRLAGVFLRQPPTEPNGKVAPARKNVYPLPGRHDPPVRFDQPGEYPFGRGRSCSKWMAKCQSLLFPNHKPDTLTIQGRP